MTESPMEIYNGRIAPLRRWIMRRKVKAAVSKVLVDRSQPVIIADTQVLYDQLYGRAGSLPSKTTNSIPSFIISNEGLRALRHLGYDLCRRCNGDGWDAGPGGIYVCPRCEGKGIAKATANQEN